MRIFFDENNNIVGYSVIFSKENKIKNKAKISTKNKNFNYLDIDNDLAEKVLIKGIDKFEIKNNKLVEKNIIEEKKIDFTTKKVIVDLENFRLSSDLKRHLKEKDNYEFKRVYKIKKEEIDFDYLYPSDRLILSEMCENCLKGKENIRVYALYYKENNDLAALSYLSYFKNMFEVKILYHNEKYDNAGYIIIYYLIKELKEEGFKYLNLGSLTFLESGINQFKKKWGKVVSYNDLTKIQ
jgi:hypothetical protein